MSLSLGIRLKEEQLPILPNPLLTTDWLKHQGLLLFRQPMKWLFFLCLPSAPLSPEGPTKHWKPDPGKQYYGNWSDRTGSNGTRSRFQ